LKPFFSFVVKIQKYETYNTYLTPNPSPAERGVIVCKMLPSQQERGWG
jgi:hypothetical protein